MQGGRHLARQTRCHDPPKSKSGPSGLLLWYRNLRHVRQFCASLPEQVSIYANDYEGAIICLWGTDRCQIDLQWIYLEAVLLEVSGPRWQRLHYQTYNWRGPKCCWGVGDPEEGDGKSGMVYLEIHPLVHWRHLRNDICWDYRLVILQTRSRLLDRPFKNNHFHSRRPSAALTRTLPLRSDKGAWEECREVQVNVRVSEGLCESS